MPDTDKPQGITLVHEHMSINLSEGDLGSDSFELLCAELTALRHAGVRRIVEMTNQVMGRNPQLCWQLEQATGIEILQSTGYYLESLMPQGVITGSVENIAQTMISDLTWGMDGTTRKARVIGEIASGINLFRKGEKKVFLAAALASRQTGAPIFTHTSLGTAGLQQARLLLEQGVSPANIVIGHMDLSCNIEEMFEVLETGVTIGIDTIGKDFPREWDRQRYDGVEADEFRADAVAAVINAGYINQLVLSLDICRKEQLRACGGYGFMHLFDTFLPLLRERGITNQQISVLLKDNPNRILAGC